MLVCYFQKPIYREVFTLIKQSAQSNSSTGRIFGEINDFPVVSPVIVMGLAYLVELFFGAIVPEDTHKFIVMIATVFTYGILFIPVISYLSFRYVFLPAIYFSRQTLKIESYYLNVLVVLIFTDAIVSILLLIKDEFRNAMGSLMVASVLTSLVALNAVGHRLFQRFHARNTDIKK